MSRFGNNHEHIVTLHNVYEEPDHIYLFMDYLEGGELFDHIIRKKFFSEHEASEVLEVITSTIKFLHENGVRNSQFLTGNF